MSDRNELAEILERRQKRPHFSAPSNPIALAPQGTEAFQRVCGRLLVAAFGSAIFAELDRCHARSDRLERALSAANLRESSPMPTTTIGAFGRRGLLSRARTPTTPNPLMSNLFGLGFAATSPHTPEQELLARKRASIEMHMKRLREEANAVRDDFFSMHDSAKGFIRQLGVSGALRSVMTVDDFGTHRSVTPDAWGDPENWEDLLNFGVFRAGGDVSFARRGTPCFLPTTVETLEAFVSARGAVGLRDIDGALFALGKVSKPKRPSASRWFTEEGGKQAAQAELSALGQNLTEAALYSAATAIYNRTYPDARVSPGAFKKAGQRKGDKRKGTVPR